MDVLGCNYWAFLVNWWALWNNPNVLWLHYQDPTKDLRQSMEKMATVLGIQWSPAQLDKVIHSSSFEYMTVPTRSSSKVTPLSTSSA
jgi:Sulfotransferase domain